jgi:hypothetical protein
MLRRRAIVVAAALLIASMAAGLLFLLPSKLDEVRAAQRRWEQGRPAHYQLRIEETYRRAYMEARCTQEIEVRDEAVAAVIQNTCPSPPQTVTRLFQQLQQSVEPVTCITFGCACDFVGTPRAEYDPHLHHPARISLRWATVPNWQHADFWRALWQLRTMPRCTPAAVPNDRTLVVMVTPLP